ncbi:MAG: hypothetical protein HOK97_05180 [Deltaproteobacteria bacterium]|jgi:hypothetical protein|nr:hypothetical protein [Deltaproteobacteria bacterium]MBT6489133.1 hypothetical protein [Deltaproteobacteria bacterium]
MVRGDNFSFGIVKQLWQVVLGVGLFGLGYITSEFLEGMHPYEVVLSKFRLLMMMGGPIVCLREPHWRTKMKSLRKRATCTVFMCAYLVQVCEEVGIRLELV